MRLDGEGIGVEGPQIDLAVFFLQGKADPEVDGLGRPGPGLLPGRLRVDNAGDAALLVFFEPAVDGLEGAVAAAGDAFDPAAPTLRPGAGHGLGFADDGKDPLYAGIAQILLRDGRLGGPA